MTVFAGDPILAADMNRALTRVIGTPTVATADLSAISSGSNTIIDSLTVPVEAGRRYKLLAYIPYTVGVTGERHYLLLCEDSVSGTQISYATISESSTTGNSAKTVWAYWTAPSTGDKTFVSCTRRASGSGAITIRGSGGQPRILTLEAAD